MSDPLTEARRLLFRANDILTGPDGASVWWAMEALADEVERLRALIDNPGDIVQTWAPTRDQIVGIAHARTVTITIPSVTIRDHLRARLEAP